MNLQTPVSTEIDVIKHLDLIAVQPPYLALHSVCQKDGFTWGTFPIEAIPEQEIFPVTITEIGRHMAILGSLAVAIENPVKETHYYLALQAKVTRHLFTESFEKELRGKTYVTNFDKKGAQIKGEVLNSNNECMFSIVVNYSTIHYRTFDRLFRQHYKPEVEYHIDSPYNKEVELQNLNLSEKECTASIGLVTEFLCQGHFHHYPALPVARLGGAFCKLSGEHYKTLTKSLKNFKITFESVEMFANFLAFEGEELTIKSRLVNISDFNCYTFENIAFNKNLKEVAKLISIIK